MFDWISKPFIEWNFIDNFIACVSIGIIGLVLIYCGIWLCILKDKIKEKIEDIKEKNKKGSDK